CLKALEASSIVIDDSRRQRRYSACAADHTDTAPPCGSVQALNPANEFTSVSQINVVTADLYCCARHSIVLALERSGGVDHCVHSQPCKLPGEVPVVCIHQHGLFSAEPQIPGSAHNPIPSPAPDQQPDG